MSQLFTKRGVVILAIILLVVISVVGLWLVFSDSNKSSSNNKPKRADKVLVDFSTDTTLLTNTQESELQTTLLTMTTSNAAQDAQQLNGKIRENSIQRVSEREVSFIVDSEELQTSYLVTRFASPTDNVDILYTVCVDKAQKIYEKDYCLVE